MASETTRLRVVAKTREEAATAVVEAARALPTWLFRQHADVLADLDIALGRLDDFDTGEGDDDGD